MTSKQKLVIALALLVVAELILFTRSFDMFFCGDSLYYLSRRLTSFGDLVQILSRVDYLEEYRPLPFVLFSFVYFPLFGLDAWGYHLIPVLFHLANTFLFFRLARRLLDGNLGAFIAAFFFGVHWVNNFITYDITMMTEFTYVFFFLLASLKFLDYVGTGKLGALAACLGSFVLSLLAKESAITFLATAFMTGLVYVEKRGEGRSLVADGARMLRKVAPIAGVAAAYLVVLLGIKDWSLFPRRPGHPHHASWTLETLRAKGRYLQWAFGIPDNLILKREAVGRLALAAALLPWVAVFALGSLAGLAARNRIVLCGLVWSIATLSPVLFLPNLTMVHYLYLPMAGLAFVFGWIAERVAGMRFLQGSRRWVPAAAAAAFLAANVSASSNHGAQMLRDSWLSNGSRVAEASLRGLREVRPELQNHTTLYFLKSNEKDLPWFFDNGRMFNVFYGNPTLRTHFADRGAKLPPRYLEDDRFLILRFIRPHIYDATDEYKSEMRQTAGTRLLPLFRPERVSFDKREGCYPGYDSFETPTGRPAFVMPIGRASVGREALVLIAGARARIDIPAIGQQDRLIFGITMPFDAGDGAEGRIYFEHDGTTDLLYSRWLSPGRVANDRRWLDESIELSKFAGRKGALRFECNSGPDLDVIGDWIAYSGLRILPSAAAPQTTTGEPRRPLWLHVTPTFVRQGDYVILSVGNGANMTIDCKLRLNGTETTKERWFTTNAAGQFAFQPAETGKWEILSIKNSQSDEWVPSPAYLVVE